MRRMHIVAALICCLVTGACSVPEFRVMTYNIHHGRGIDGRVDLERIAAVIRAADVDVVALNEVDRGTRRTDGRDLAAELAQLCGMTAVFEKNIDFQGGEYGNALLTRLPIRAHRNYHYAMLRPGEQRGLLQVDLAFAGGELRFWVTHIDHRPDDAERVSNVGEILGILGESTPTPTILLGDFNDLPDSRTVTGLLAEFVDAWPLVGEGEGLTYPSPKPTKRIDYVFFQRGTGLVPTAAAVPATQASDHRPLVVAFELRGTEAADDGR